MSLFHRTYLYPERRQFKIRGTERRVKWYYTKSRAPLDAPPAETVIPKHQSLYVHRHKSGAQIWMYDEDDGDGGGGPWKRIYPGHDHPDLDGYVLHLLESDQPRWVKEESARAYEIERARRRRMERAM